MKPSRGSNPPARGALGGVRRFTFTVALLGLAIGFGPRAAHGQIAAWDVNGIRSSVNNPFSATTLDAGLASASLSLGSGTVATGPLGTFAGGNFLSTSLASAIADQKYLTFSIAPNSGSTFSVSSLAVTFGFNFTDPFHVALLSSTTGFTADSALWTFDTSGTMTPAPQTVDLSSVSALQGLTSAAEFRFYGYTDGSGGGQLRILDGTGNDLAVYGTAIPEPSTYALVLSSAALAGAAWRRRRVASRAPRGAGP